MSMQVWARCRWAGAMVLVSAFASANPRAAEPAPDPDVERLRARIEAIEAQAADYQDAAGVERLLARQALAALAASKAKADDRPHLLFVTERRVEIAEIGLRNAQLRERLAALARIHDQIVLEASRRDAEQARLEADRLRLQSLARAEEAQRAQSQSDASAAAAEAALAQAEQARILAEARAREAALARQEAELAAAAAESLRLQLDSLTSRRDARGEVMILSGDVFPSGQANLRPEARANLARVVEFVNAAGDAPIRIEGHTDSRGSAKLNQALSQRRAEAVRDALAEEGVDPARMTAVGRGEEQPIASNDSEAGRARNRRVEIIVQTQAGSGSERNP